jgi:uncharacterized membrane protein
MTAMRPASTVFAFVVLALTIVLLALPTGFERELSGETVKLRVTRSDNAGVRQHGIVRIGDQRLWGTILSGARAGQEVEAVNHLFGKLELDKMFAPGDTALALLDAPGGTVLKVSVQDHYRVEVEVILFGLFAALLLGYAGFTGARALLSFLFAALAIWKILLPGMLRGWNPVAASLGVTAVLCLAIIFLVSGFNRKGLVACCGSLAGVAFTACLSLLFGRLFLIHGAIKPFAETLLYSGFGHLDLSAIFLGGIFLASSGAVMDLSMDIAAAMEEVRRAHPDIARRDLIRSGNAGGRMVVGTMTTTLLLAYTGGFSTLLMVFIAQGVPVLNVINIQYVAMEILHTLVGSFGLVAVAPFTALLGGLLLLPRRPAPSSPVPSTNKH